MLTIRHSSRLYIPLFLLPSLLAGGVSFPAAAADPEPVAASGVAPNPASLDVRLFHAINLHPGHNDSLDPLFGALMPLGSREAGAIPVGLYLSGLANNDSRQSDAGVLCAAAMVSSALVTEGAKGLVSRRRPMEALGQNQVRVVGPPVADSRSFPSGHTSTAFAWATVLAGVYPEGWPLFYGAATLVGVGRIRMGSHYPSDVLAGAVIGFTVGRVVVHNRETILRRGEPTPGGASMVISRRF